MTRAKGEDWEEAPPDYPISERVTVRRVVDRSGEERLLLDAPWRWCLLVELGIRENRKILHKLMVEADDPEARLVRCEEDLAASRERLLAALESGDSEAEARCLVNLASYEDQYSRLLLRAKHPGPPRVFNEYRAYEHFYMHPRCAPAFQVGQALRGRGR